MRRLFVLLLCCAAFGMFLLDPASAAVPDDNALDDLLDAFSVGFGERATAIGNLTTTLFYGLVMCEFVISACLLAVQPGGADIQSFSSFILKRFFVIGLFVYFLQEGSALASMIVGSFSAAGIAAGGPPLSPADILDTGVRISGELNSAASWFTTDGLFTSIAGLIIVLLFGSLAAQMVVVMAEVYIVLSSGVILLAFGGFSATQGTAINYFQYAIATGFKLMLMQIIAGLGIDIIQGWTQDLRQNGVEITAVIGTTLVMYTIAKDVPSMAADMIRGTMSGRMSVTEAAGQIARSTATSTSTIAGAATSMANSASAIKQAFQAAKQGGATGVGSSIAGASSALGKAVAADIGRSVRGTQGGNSHVPGPAGHKMSQRVSNSLRASNASSGSAGNKGSSNGTGSNG